MDKIKIRNEIETTISLFQKYKDCKEKHRKNEVRKLGDLADECTEEKNIVFDYLESLTQEEVTQILAIAYAGRDYVICTPEDDTFISFEEHYKLYREWEKSGAIIQMIEKTDLIDYLNAGMKYFSI